ncbi:MAG TPA: recombinase RecA [Planctomycetota bacterium]|nr:recombinase RecA [Planctomycetota bacterium]
MAVPPAPPQRDERRTEALKTALAQIEKQFGKGSIMRLGGDAKLDIEGITTGSLGLDLALGGKGFPRGRVIEVFGPEGSGKTTLCLTIIANAQKAGGSALFIDAEHAMDPSYAQKLGVNLDELLLNQPDSGEQALEIADMMVRSSSLDVIVIDSVAALVPKAELEGEMGDTHVGLQARLMSQALRKLTASVSKSKTCLVFINQIREKIGVMFGSPETTPGGRALKFYSSVRVDVRRIGHLKEGEVEIGTRVKAHIVKNKIAPPFKKVEFDMLFASGISYEGDILDLGEIHGVLERSGGWYSYKDEKIDNGREKCRGVLKSKPALAFKIENDIRAKLGIEPRPAPVPRPTAPSAVDKPAIEAPKKPQGDDDKKPAKK